MEMEADKSGLVSHPKRTLAGKFFTSLVPPSFDRTETTLRQQWKLSGGLKVSPLKKDNIILFEFEKKRDKKNVAKDGPWNVDGIILVLKECTQGISMADIDFSVACFKVKVIGLSYFNYTGADAEKIVKELSDEPFLWIDYKYATRSFWVEAKIDLKKPLSPGFYIDGRWFVPFKYKNLGEFCENCGMVSHRKCGEVAKTRPLTAEFKTNVYGPWLRYDPEVAGNGLPVKSNYFQPQGCDGIGFEYEETLSYAQFFVVVLVDVVYASEHEWDGKKLTRSMFESDHAYLFRFPCFPTRVIKDVLALEIDNISPMAKLTVEDKAVIVHGLVDLIMKERKTWSKKRWVPLIVSAKKTVMVPPVDMEAMLEESKDKNFRHSISLEVIKKIGKPLGKSDGLLMKTARDAIGELGLTSQFPEYFIELLMRAAKSCVSKLTLRSDDDHEIARVRGPDMDSFGTCCICQEDFFLGEKATVISPCSHVFHTRCIDHWIQESPKCPLCCLQLQVSTHYL